MLPENFFDGLGSACRNRDILGGGGHNAAMKRSKREASLSRSGRSLARFGICIVPPLESLQGFKHWAIVLPEQALGYMEPIVGVDADQMGIKCSVMDLRQRDAIGDYWLTEPLVIVGHDVGGIQEGRFW
jgi:hypothetical protein